MPNSHTPTPVRLVLLALAVTGVAALARGAQPTVAQAPDPELQAQRYFSRLLQERSPIPTEDSGTTVINGSVSDSLVGATTLTGTQPFPHTALYGGANSSGWPFVGSTAKVGTCSNNPLLPCSVNTDCGSASITCNNPAMRPPDGTPLNQSVIEAYAKFPMSIIPITPLADGRPDIIPAIKASNPNTKVWGYAVGQVTWCPGYPGNISYPVGWYYRDYYLAVTGGDPNCSTSSNGLLWNQNGRQFGPANVNLAHRDGNGNYDVAEAIANAIYSHSNPAHGFDGIFIDIFCPNGIAWTETTAPCVGNLCLGGVRSGQSCSTDSECYDIIDYARAGYGTDNANPANRTAFDAGWAAAHRRMSQRLRELAIADGHPNYPIAGNCGQSDANEFSDLNGWMRENYPFQNGGTFYSNMLAYPWGFYHQDRLFRAPQTNFVFTATDPSTTPYTLYNQRKMRFGLGSVTLGNGYHAFHDASAAPTFADYEFNWYDEYGVNVGVPQSDPNFGRAMNGAAYSGWLGQPLGDAYQMINPDFTAHPDLLTTNQGFETAGSPFASWNTGTNGGSQVTFTRDTSTAAEGNASAKIHIDQVGSVPANITLSPATNFPVAAFQQYSVTFWAKASTPRPLDVYVYQGGWPSTVVPITTEWRRYQVQVTKSISTTSSSYLLFVLGHETGDIWIDDVHVQTGASSVYRRDFEYGTVLVNPTDSTQTVQLEKPFKKILGTVNPTLNDGSTISSVTLAGSSGGIGDAVFLLSLDTEPPSTVTDLRSP